jgi:hypothetical protein
MSFVKFEQFFRAAGGVRVDRDDVKRYLGFVNDALYDLLLMGQAAAKADARDIIEPWDLPITRGLQESIHAYERRDEEIELRAILEDLAARPPLDAAPSEETENRLPLIFGGVSTTLADVQAGRRGAEGRVHPGVGTHVQPVPAADLARAHRVPQPRLGGWGIRAAAARR